MVSAPFAPFVPVVPERPEVIEEFKALKKEYKIGIFGSYEQTNLTKLSLLQNFLNREGYENTRIALDLMERYPRKKGEHKSTYIHRLSNNLIRISDIHIFVFFNEADGQHEINTSTFGEMQKGKACKKKNIILYFDKRVRKQIASYYKTYFDDPPEGWQIEGYSDDIETKYEHVAGFLLEMCNKIRSK